MIIFCAKYLIFILVLVVLLAWLKASAKMRWQFAAAVVLAGVIAVALAKVSSKLYYDPRPFVTHSIKPLVPHSADNGFPSEHTLLAMTLSAVVYYYRPRLAAGLFGLTLLVGISRVLAHVHSPLDILGGLILGVLAGWAGYALAKKLVPVRQNPAIDQQND